MFLYVVVPWCVTNSAELRQLHDSFLNHLQLSIAHHRLYSYGTIQVSGQLSLPFWQR